MQVETAQRAVHAHGRREYELTGFTTARRASRAKQLHPGMRPSALRAGRTHDSFHAAPLPCESPLFVNGDRFT